MMFDLSSENIQAIARAIERATGVSVFPDLPPIREWLGPIRELSDRFNGLKTARGFYCDPQLEEAYCLYFFPVNVVRVLYVLSRMVAEHQERVHSVLSHSSLTVWDIGCGPGTASFAFSVLTQNRETPAKYVLADTNPKMLALAEKTLHPMPVQTHVSSLGQGVLPSGDGPDVVFMANVLNEMDESGAIAGVERVIDRLADGGLLILMEPALRKHSRRLLSVRDHVLTSRSSAISLLYPCTHVQPCPILRDPENWCYMSCLWERPEWISVLDRHLGLNKRELDFTPVVFQKTSGMNATAGDCRVVSNLTSRKWGWECFLCGVNGLTRTVLRNKAAKKLQRGDVIREDQLASLKGG